MLILAGDIGGTSTRLACFDITDDMMVPVVEERFPSRDAGSLEEVVSRFASAPGLKLTVTFEVPVAPDQTKSKTDETKSALRELGLSDEVS